MWAAGHLALGYFTGKGTSKALNERINIPLLFFTSIAPDIDFLIPGVAHRGPTHSLVIYALALIPFYMVFGKKAIIYFMSISSHALLGDLLFTEGHLGVQILWPLTSTWFLGPYLPAFSGVFLEWVFFSLFMITMIKARDLQELFQQHPLNLALTIPVFTIIMPVFLYNAPPSLLIPHLVCTAILAYLILTDLKVILVKKIR